MKLAAHGISAELPPGWEGRITKRPQPVGPEGRTGPRGTVGDVTRPVVHLANFALPEERGDYGSGAVDLMGPENVFVSLFEFGPESVGTALFSRRGVPTLTPKMFSTNGLQKSIRGQAGCQRWFTESGRPFCLYVVLGRFDRATRLVPLANTAVRSIRIEAP